MSSILRIFPSFIAGVLFMHMAVLGHAQISDSVTRKITITRDTTQLDSLSIVPESFKIIGLNTNQYIVDFASGTLLVTDASITYPIEIECSFESFPFNFSEPYRHKELSLITEPNRVYNPFRSDNPNQVISGLDLGDLEKRGSVSRGITVGNNQNLSVNSSLNLQLSGHLNDRFSMLAAIADDNIPIQPDGNTQQLQDFDQVYIQIYDDNNRITAGDFQVEHDDGYFMRFNKKLQGGRYEGVYFPVKGDSQKVITADASGAVSRGKFARKTIQGIEGNQGPYRLSGAEGEQFIVVLSGTERIYLDGRLLVRGQENDYVINYNTSELTFTAKVPVTKDRRILAEYQYSDRNYARSLIYASSGYESQKMKLNFSMYSEQDSKNQPLQQDLTDAQKSVLRSIGDSLDEAIASSLDSVMFTENQLLYEQRDTVYYDPLRDDSLVAKDVLIYSTDPNKAHFQATFSEVGFGNGNYVQGDLLAFGRIYQWVPPINGVSQGNFEPVVLLVTPKTRQMASISGEYKITDGITASVEWAGTQYDINTFSTADKSDDLGMASKIAIKGEQPIDGYWRAIAGLDFEFVQNTFQQIERFRPVEFDRDWNIRDLKIHDNQNILGAELGAAHSKVFKTVYGIKSFNAGNDFQGIQNSIGMNTGFKHLKGSYDASLTNQNGSLVTSDYFQHNSLVTVPIWRIQLGYKDDFEQNKRYDPVADTLNNLSYRFWEWEGSVTNEDSAQNLHRLSYAERTDWLKDSSILAKATFAKIYGYQMELRKWTNSQLGVRVNYRTLEILDQKLTQQKKENTLISRAEYTFRAFKGSVTSSTFYEIGSGLENRKEYIYLETTPGQGTHIHIDYNDNGQKELNEFEQAVQADQIASANYLKVFVPTDEYIRSYTNQFSQSLFLRPSAIWNRSSVAAFRIISHFSDQFSYAVDRKNYQIPLIEQFNPFLFDLADTVLQSTNSNLRNIFYFNQSHPIFGADVNYQRLEGRNFLTTGFESRSLEKTGLGFRWNFTDFLGLEARGEQGNKITSSNAGSLSARNYNIFYQEIEPKLSLQPGTKWRLSILYNYKEQRNRLDSLLNIGGGERSYSTKGGMEFTLSSPEKGSLITNISLIQITYNGSIESAVGFEMLDGLQPGLNATWGVSYQRTLSNNLQVSLNYNGRQSPGLRMIHTGGVQARAFF
ncbi:MAG: hypothetical protein R2813_03595 [Flavobacteriales bacterium]